MAQTLDFRPGTVNVPAIQGSDINFTVTITEADEVTPVNITGYTFTMDIVTSTGTVLQSLTVGSGITIVSALNGQLTITIEGTNLVFANTKCDINVFGLLWVTNTTSIRRPYAQFIITLSPQIPTV